VSAKREKLEEPEADEPEDRKRKEKEEDVCFVCKDGGDLIMCDRWTCPKAYHLDCIEKNEEFLEGKGTWTCGYHYCSKCGKKQNDYKCFTCLTVYCKECFAEEGADFKPVTVTLKNGKQTAASGCVLFSGVILLQALVFIPGGMYVEEY
jgi:hypothetical protein